MPTNQPTGPSEPTGRSLPDRRLTVRIPSELAVLAQQAADADDRSLGSLIRIALATYVSKNG